MESIDKVQDGLMPARIDKKLRLQTIMANIRNAEPANTAKEAHQMLTEAFKITEDSSVTGSNPDQKMSVGDFDQMASQYFGNTYVRTFEYHKHLLLIGENGAIEIRSSAQNHSRKSLDPSPFGDNPLILEKAGADGKKIWDESTS